MYITSVRAAARPFFNLFKEEYEYWISQLITSYGSVQQYYLSNSTDIEIQKLLNMIVNIFFSQGSYPNGTQQLRSFGALRLAAAGPAPCVVTQHGGESW